MVGYIQLGKSNSFFSLDTYIEFNVFYYEEGPHCKAVLKLWYHDWNYVNIYLAENSFLNLIWCVPARDAAVNSTGKTSVSLFLYSTWGGTH